MVSLSSRVWQYLWFVAGYISNKVISKGCFRYIWRKQVLRYVILGISLELMAFMTVIVWKYNISSRIACIIFVVGILSSLCDIEGGIPNRIHKGLAKIGKNTLPVYAIHWCLLFSPLYRIDFYSKFFSQLPLFYSSMIIAIVY